MGKEHQILAPFRKHGGNIGDIRAKTPNSGSEKGLGFFPSFAVTGLFFPLRMCWMVSPESVFPSGENSFGLEMSVTIRQTLLMFPPGNVTIAGGNFCPPLRVKSGEVSRPPGPSFDPVFVNSHEFRLRKGRRSVRIPNLKKLMGLEFFGIIGAWDHDAQHFLLKTPKSLAWFLRKNPGFRAPQNGLNQTGAAVYLEAVLDRSFGFENSFEMLQFEAGSVQSAG